jgi:YegS/Rv2252/BmrU family lipid kinase
MAKKVAFIINGARKQSVQVKRTITDCENHSAIESQSFLTNGPKEAIAMAKQACLNSFDVIVAVGGDGTVNEVVNGIVESEITSVTLGILPNGTGNDFVRGTNLVLNHDSFIDAVLANETQSVDVGKIETSLGITYFINITDIGFGGKVVQILEKQRRFLGGKISYGIAILRAFMGYRLPVLKIKTANFNFEDPVLMVAICNGTIFGDGLTINPFAKINDGKLNITLLGNVSLLDYIKNLKNLKLGKKINHPEAIYFETEKIEISLVNGFAVAEVDGEYLASVNLSISVLPNAISLLVY